MVKDQSMNDDDWNKWTEDVRTWYIDVDTHAANSISAGLEEDIVMDCIDDIEKYLARGDKRDSRRIVNKDHIQKAGNILAGWPKIRGIASSLPDEVQATTNAVLVGFDLANAAYYDALVEAGLEHYEMQRASKKNGGTDGTPFGNREAFVKAKHNSQKQSLTRDYNAGLWGGLEVSNPVMRPYIAKDGDDEDEDDTSEDES
tara:strand:+ start:1196 stop:1798 length:603 start_codon:yes stop_codon:yes gene_type:complete